MSAVTDATFEKVEQLLGGRKVLGRSIDGPLDAHDLIVAGLPSAALRYLVTNLVVLQATESVGKAVGMSLRTYQRKQGGSAKASSAVDGSCSVTIRA